MAFLALVLCCFGASPAVSANCEAVIRLARLYDAFYAITRESGDIRTRAAARLYPALASMDVEEFAQELDASFSEEDVVNALETARALAREVIMDADLSPFRALDARDEAAFLADFIDRSRCLSAASGGGADNPVGGSEDEGKRKLTFGPKSKSNGVQSFVDAAKPSMLVFLVAGGMVALGTGGALVARSRRVKIHMAERLPRHRISLDIAAA